MKQKSKPELILKFNQHQQQLSAVLSSEYPDLLRRFPVTLYLKEMAIYQGYYHYFFISDKLKAIFDTVEKAYQIHGTSLWHKFVLCHFVQNTLSELASRAYPESIKGLYLKWADRIEHDLTTKSDSYYHQRNSNFQKDLAVFSGRAIPVGGAWIVELSWQNIQTLKIAGHHYESSSLQPSADQNEDQLNAASANFVARLNKKFSQLLKYFYLHQHAWALKNRFRGAKAYYAIHTVDRFLPKISPERMQRAYRNIAELIQLNSKVQGIFRESWFLDPHLKAITPGLSFFWELPQQYGAELFAKDRPEHVVKNAIAMSSQRAQLYRQGKYLPTRYAYVWHRKDLLQWHQRQHEAE